MPTIFGEWVNSAAHAAGLPEPCEHSHQSKSEENSKTESEIKAAEQAQYDADYANQND